MSTPSYIVATLQPAPGKTQEVIKTLHPFAEHVNATVPGCLQYQIFQPMGAEGGDTPVFFIELWNDMAALDHLREGEEYQALMAKAGSEGLLSAVPEFNILQSVGGFGPR